jgi:hypothetical protein
MAQLQQRGWGRLVPGGFQLTQTGLRFADATAELPYGEEQCCLRHASSRPSIRLNQLTDSPKVTRFNCSMNLVPN